MNLEELVDTLSTLGIAHEVRRSGADGAILLLPEYGRVLGIWPHWRAENALWVNPRFLQSLKAGAKDDGWNNPGGDRVWLAPAEEFLSEGLVSPVIDPGRFSLTHDRNGPCMTNRGEVYARRSGSRVGFRLARRIRPLDEPAIDASCGQTWLRRAGWEEELELEIEGRSSVTVQMWSIAQAPPGSELLAAKDRLACIEEAESDRARLLAKLSPSAVPAVRPAPTSEKDPPAELSFLSPPLLPGVRRRLRWKTFVYAFSGRSAEVHQFAARMLYSSHR